MGLNLIYNDGQTPLDEDEKEGLLIKSIATRGELDEFEQQNIEDVIQWSLTRKFKSDQILTEPFILALHKKCMEGFGVGLANTEEQIRILGLTN